MKLSLKKQINAKFPKVRIRDNLLRHLASLYTASWRHLYNTLNVPPLGNLRGVFQLQGAMSSLRYSFLLLPQHTHHQLTPSTAKISPKTSWDSKKGTPFNVKKPRQLPFPNRKRAQI